MKNCIIILIVLFITISCQNTYDKGKKGDFLFRKCAKCGLN